LTIHYINDTGFEVPDNKIIIVPMDINNNTGYSDEIIESLNGKPKRDWFDPHYYYCLPLTIGNQYGFIVKSMRDYNLYWDGTTADAEIIFLNEDNAHKQTIKNGFRNGVVTIQNNFHFKTPPGINLMTIQPPNFFVPGIAAMTGVIECDQIRRDFTFNFKVTVPNYEIRIRKGDPIGAFIPIPRYFVDKFEIDYVANVFKKELWDNELIEVADLSNERNNQDKEKSHESGRRYFNGTHTNNTVYKDHQKRMNGSYKNEY
jgi:hypothetical protein